MKTARTYVFMFVPIPPEWLAHEPRAWFARPAEREFSADENIMAQHDGERNSSRCETRALPNHLFWTWFVDNPRPCPLRRS